MRLHNNLYNVWFSRYNPNGIPFEWKWDEPTYPTFHVEFDIDDKYFHEDPFEVASQKTEKIRMCAMFASENDKQSPGINPIDRYDVVKYFEDLTDNTTSSSTATGRYVRNNALTMQRAEAFKIFVSELRRIQYQHPWYFQKISSLSDVFNTTDTLIKKDFKITFDCLESRDLSMTKMFEAYRMAMYDQYLGKYTIPENYRKFRMKIYVLDVRRPYEYEDGAVTVESDNTRRGLNRVFNNLVNTGKSALKRTLETFLPTTTQQFLGNRARQFGILADKQSVQGAAQITRRKIDEYREIQNEMYNRETTGGGIRFDVDGPYSSILGKTLIAGSLDLVSNRFNAQNKMGMQSSSDLALLENARSIVDRSTGDPLSRSFGFDPGRALTKKESQQLWARPNFTFEGGDNLGNAETIRAANDDITKEIDYQNTNIGDIAFLFSDPPENYTVLEYTFHGCEFVLPDISFSENTSITESATPASYKFTVNVERGSVRTHAGSIKSRNKRFDNFFQFNNWMSSQSDNYATTNDVRFFNQLTRQIDRIETTSTTSFSVVNNERTKELLNNLSTQPVDASGNRIAPKVNRNSGYPFLTNLYLEKIKDKRKSRLFLNTLVPMPNEADRLINGGDAINLAIIAGTQKMGVGSPTAAISPWLRRLVVSVPTLDSTIYELETPNELTFAKNNLLINDIILLDLTERDIRLNRRELEELEENPPSLNDFGFLQPTEKVLLDRDGELDKLEKNDVTMAEQVTETPEMPPDMDHEVGHPDLQPPDLDHLLTPAPLDPPNKDHVLTVAPLDPPDFKNLITPPELMPPDFLNDLKKAPLDPPDFENEILIPRLDPPGFGHDMEITPANSLGFNNELVDADVPDPGLLNQMEFSPSEKPDMFNELQTSELEDIDLSLKLESSLLPDVDFENKLIPLEVERVKTDNKMEFSEISEIELTNEQLSTELKPIGPDHTLINLNPNPLTLSKDLQELSINELNTENELRSEISRDVSDKHDLNEIKPNDIVNNLSLEAPKLEIPDFKNKLEVPKLEIPDFKNQLEITESTEKIQKQNTPVLEQTETKIPDLTNKMEEIVPEKEKLDIVSLSTNIPSQDKLDKDHLQDTKVEKLDTKPISFESQKITNPIVGDNELLKNQIEEKRRRIQQLQEYYSSLTNAKLENTDVRPPSLDSQFSSGSDLYNFISKMTSGEC